MQVVTALNQTLSGLAAQRAELQHELGAAKERWQSEEAVRIRQGDGLWANLCIADRLEAAHTLTGTCQLPNGGLLLLPSLSRLQEQLLEVKAREARLAKERESLEGAVDRLEAQRAGLDAELAQMRRMLEDAGGWLAGLGTELRMRN